MRVRKPNSKTQVQSQIVDFHAAAMLLRSGIGRPDSSRRWTIALFGGTNK
jgi:hypothetical protein